MEELVDIGVVSLDELDVVERDDLKNIDMSEEEISRFMESKQYQARQNK